MQQSRNNHATIMQTLALYRIPSGIRSFFHYFPPPGGLVLTVVSSRFELECKILYRTTKK